MWIGQPTIDVLQALGIGFAFSGLLASAFELVTDRPAGLDVLRRGGLPALFSVPVLVFAAPLLILRGVSFRPTVRGTAASVVLGGIAASVWSLMAGRVLLDLAQVVTGA